MLFDLLFGFLLVFAGRNLFWLCVGIIGFLMGVQCASLLGYSNGGMAVLIALFLGIAGTVLAVSFEWFVVVFGIGFLGGGYVLANMFPQGVMQEPYSWSIFIVGGIVGMCLMIIVFDWTLILISSLLGATLILNAFHGTNEMRELLFVASVVTGILVQYLELSGTDNRKVLEGGSDAQ